MKNFFEFSLKNRIAFYYMSATALLAAVLFIMLYSVVYNTVYTHLDEDLDAESEEVNQNLFVTGNDIVFANPFEWGEREHGQIEVNPTFIQVMDTGGSILRKTKNLQNETLNYDPELKAKSYFSSTLSGKPMRQLQMPVHNESGDPAGYMIISIPLEESSIVLDNLKFVLLFSFPVVLVILFFVTRLIAGKSIKPINEVIAAADKITKQNLDKRIELPQKKDEIFVLASAVNRLLDRLQDGIIRENQFTSDASHELRTPLAVIKGTLEVLIRKPRDIFQYERKIKYAIGEINRMTVLVDQLLMLARYENGKASEMPAKANLTKALETVIFRLQDSVYERGIRINYKPGKIYEVEADCPMLETVLENILSNAVKYSYPESSIDITFSETSGTIICSIRDYGIGMTDAQVNKIFHRFYRTDDSRQSDIPGNGLGLSIVKKLADLLNIHISYQSRPAEGTTVHLAFNKKYLPVPLPHTGQIEEKILS